MDKDLRCQKRDLDQGRSVQSMTADFTRSMEAENQKQHQLQETSKEAKP